MNLLRIVRRQFLSPNITKVKAQIFVTTRASLIALPTCRQIYSPHGEDHFLCTHVGYICKGILFIKGMSGALLSEELQDIVYLTTNFAL